MSNAYNRRVRGSTLIAALLVGAVAMTAVTLRAATAGATAVSSSAPGETWLDNLKGEHRQLFDAPEPNGGVPLVHAMNYYDTYNKAFGVADSRINAVLTFYGNTTFYGLNDAMWSKYRLGEFLKTIDARTREPAVVNPWRVAPFVLGMTLPQASIESLQKRGATFIICNNALGIFAGMVAQARGLQTDAVYADMKANILPGVTLVPGMVVAIEQAQHSGITYHRQ